MSDSPRLPDANLVVDYGVPCPGSSNPMPADVRRAYQDRIRASVEAQAAGARVAATLFIGAGAETGKEKL